MSNINSRQHWSRQSVAEPLASFAMHAEMSHPPTASPLQCGSEAQQPAVADCNKTVAASSVKSVTEKAKQHRTVSSQKCSRKGSENMAAQAVKLPSHVSHCGPPVCIGSLERSWSAMSLL